MEITPVPVPPTPTSGGFQQESNTFSSVGGIYQSLNGMTVRVSKNSPPKVGIDVQEAQLIIDRTTGKLHTVINGVLKGVALT
jgi:hypothetical protein